MERLFIIALLIGGCMGLSFLFSGMEAGVLALSRIRVRQRARAGNARAIALQRYLDSPEDFLWTILIGNTLANLVAVGLIVVLLDQALGQWPVLLVVVFILVIILFYAFCELLPKTLFRMFPNRLTLMLLGPFRVIRFILSPLVALMTKLSRGLLRWTGGRTFTGHLFGTREEMRLFMQESAQGLTSEERQMINRVLDLQNVTVRNVATPIEKLGVITVQTPMSEALKVSQQVNRTRLPVWREENGRRRVIGMVSLRAAVYEAELDSSKTAGDYLRPALYLDEETRLEDALKRMQRAGERIAIVLNRDQREAGFITLHDILSLIFGEVRL